MAVRQELPKSGDAVGLVGSSAGSSHSPTSAGRESIQGCSRFLGLSRKGNGNCAGEGGLGAQCKGPQGEAHPQSCFSSIQMSGIKASNLAATDADMGGTEKEDGYV